MALLQMAVAIDTGTQWLHRLMMDNDLKFGTKCNAPTPVVSYGMLFAVSS